MTEYRVSVHIDLGSLIGGLQRSLQRAIDLVSFGLVAAEKATNGQLMLPGAYFQVATAGNEARGFETAKAEFPGWVLTCGIRDCVEEVNSFLEEARRVCAFYSFGGQSKITGEEWNNRIDKETIKFHRFGLPDKITFLKNTYEPDVVPELAEEILSINNARNCLVHRRGKVTDKDFNSPDGLLVEWLKMELIVEGPTGQRILMLPADVDAGEIISIRQTKTSRLFKLGEAVSFDAQEFSELSWTFFVFGQQFIANLEKYARTKGVPFREPISNNVQSNESI